MAVDIPWVARCPDRALVRISPGYGINPDVTHYPSSSGVCRWCGGYITKIEIDSPLGISLKAWVTVHVIKEWP